MEINKTYDITELGNKVQEAIESCVAGKSNRCSIDLLTANEILEVLRETKTREERHQTLEFALSFVEKEDGTQTNEMELYNQQEETEIVRVEHCHNLGCNFNAGRSCITTPELVKTTNECLSTNNGKYIIHEDDIITEDEEQSIIDVVKNRPDCFHAMYQDEEVCKCCPYEKKQYCLEYQKMMEKQYPYSEEKKPECYCESIPPDDVARKCSECKLYYSCTSDFKEEHNKTKSHVGCFGKYDKDDIVCVCCPSGDKCLKETENRTNG